MCRRSRGRVSLTASGKWKVLCAQGDSGQSTPGRANPRPPLVRPRCPHGVVLGIVAEALGDGGGAEEEGKIGEHVLAGGRDGARRGELARALSVYSGRHVSRKVVSFGVVVLYGLGGCGLASRIVSNLSPLQGPYLLSGMTMWESEWSLIRGFLPALCSPRRGEPRA